MVADFWLSDGTGPHRAVGTCCYTMMKSIGYLNRPDVKITEVKWLRTANMDLLKNEQEGPPKASEPTRRVRLSQKEQKRLERRIDAWTK